MIRAAALLCTALTAACALGPDPAPPQLPLPAAWDSADAAAGWPDAAWWRGFSSPELNRLVAEAEANNRDLAAAVARIRQAQAQARIAGAALLPTLSAGGGASRSWTDGSSTSSSRTTSSSSRQSASNSVQASLTAAYQVDLFGGNAASAEAAELRLDATRFDRQTVALTLQSEVALTYFDILSLRDRIRLATETLRIAESVLTVLTRQVEAGAATELELAQQRASIAQQRATIPALEQSEREARSALAVLLGRAPQGFDVEGRTLGELALPTVSAGLPVGLLERRPDLKQAEARARAAAGDVAAARAARFPSLSLTAPASLQSAALSSLINGPTAVYSLAASITAPIFEGGRLEAQEDQAVAARQELIEQYAAAVLAALQDTENALSAVRTAAAQHALAAEAQAQAAEALRIVDTRFRIGTVDFLNVLDAQRALFQANDSVAQANLSRYSAATSLFRALGGGWDGTLPPQR